MKLYILLAVASFLAISSIHADGSLSLILHVFDNEKNESADFEAFEVDAHIKEKYQSAAKFLAKSVKSKSNTVETSIVTYETTRLGVNCHVGWYADGNICTALDGTEEGKQIVFLNGAVVGISYDVAVKKDHFVHKYTWGRVYSYPNYQVVKFS